MRVPTRRGVLRVTAPALVIGRTVGVVVVVAPVTIKAIHVTPGTGGTKEHYARVGVAIPTSKTAIVTRAIMVTLSRSRQLTG